MTSRRRALAGLAAAAAVAVVVSACTVEGAAQPDPAVIQAVEASSLAVLTSRAATVGLSGEPTPGTIEDHSTSAAPPGSPSDLPRTTGATPTEILPSSGVVPSSGPVPTSGPLSPSSTTVAGPTVTMANDGFAVSIMVTTVWARALVAKGANVAIRTIGETPDQIAALRSGAVDLVQEYNSGLLNYLDSSDDAIGQSAVDHDIATHLPAGLSILHSTPAKDDVQLTVSAATAAKYRLHSISDLSTHLAELTLLLPDDSSAKSFTNGLSSYYGLTFAHTRTTDFAGARTIAAIRTGPTVGLMDASQFQIDDNKFVVLTDPEHLFLTENFVPLIGGSRITPEMKATLNAVSAKLSVSTLRGLRKKVATGQGSFTEVADQWLASVGLR